MTESQARDEICRIGKSLFDRGYVHATAGNISIRLDNSFLITPTDACLGFLEPNDIAKVNADGEHVSGARPSKTLKLHRSIYEAAARAASTPTCVIHTHSTNLVSLTLRRVLHQGPVGFDEILEAITPYYLMKVGRVPLLPYLHPGSDQTVLFCQQAINAYYQYGVKIRAVMLDRLGPNVWHETASAAMAVLEELEETAKLVCQNAGVPIEPLNESQIQSLRDTFGVQW
jgi:3-dehydro-4-phosphotetronate decarboxylase